MQWTTRTTVLAAVVCAACSSRTTSDPEPRRDDVARPAAAAPVLAPAADPETGPLPDGVVRLGSPAFPIALVQHIAVSPDGRTIASDGSGPLGDDAITPVFLWDVATQTQRTMLPFRGDDVRGLAFSPDGSLIAAAGKSGTVTLWTVATGAERITLSQTEPAQDVAFAADGKTVFAAARKQIARWDVATGKPGAAIPVDVFSFESFAISHAGTRIAVGGFGAIAILDAATGAVLRDVKVPSAVRDVAFSPDDTQLVATSHEEAGIWDVASGDRLRSFTGFKDYVRAVAWSPDASVVATATNASEIKLWDAKTGALLGGVVTSGTPYRIAFARDGSTLYSGEETSDHTGIRTWNVDHLRRGQTDAVITLGAIALSGDGARLVAVDDTVVHVWSLRSGTIVRTLTGNGEALSSVAISADGKVVSAGTTDGTRLRWDAKTGAAQPPPAVQHQAASEPPATLRAVLDRAHCTDALVSHTGVLAALCETRVRIWTAATGHELTSLGHAADGVRAFAWSADGTRLAVAREDLTVTVWPAAGMR